MAHSAHATRRRRAVGHAFCAGLLFVVGTTDTTAAPRWYLPDYAEVQYAGNIGFVAVGAGKFFHHETIQAGLFYGIVPPGLNSETIHSLALKTTLRPYRKTLVDGYALTPIYLGVAWIYTLGEEFRMNHDKTWPNGYYPQAAFRGQPYLGIALERELATEQSTVRSLGIYFEIGALFDDIDRDFHSQQFLYIHDILNLAVGATIRLF